MELEKSRSGRYVYHLRLRLADGHKGNWYLLVSDHAQLENFIRNLDPSAVLLSIQLMAFEAETLPDQMNFFIDFTRK